MTVVNLVDARHTATTTTVATTTTTTTTPRSRNNKKRSTSSNRTIIVSIGMIFVMALYYPTVGTFRFSRIQQQLLQSVQDPPLLYFNNNNEDSNKVDDSDKKATEKEIESEADFSTTQKQKRLSPKLVRAKKGKRDRIKHNNKKGIMKRSNNNNNNNNDKLITDFDDHGVNQQPNGFIVIKDDDDSSSVLATKLRNDLELCFSPLINNDAGTIKSWLKGKQDHQHFLCQLEGIGTFQIIECMRHDIYFIESRDEADYGTSYFMKLGPSPKVLRDEMELIYYLSTINTGNVHKLTAKPHPRYPYLEWKRTKSKTEKFNQVAVIVEERLNFVSLDKFHKNLTTLDQMMSPTNQKQMVQCWKDVVTVTEALWDYQGGHYLHNDIHNAQILMVPITIGGDNNNSNDANTDAAEDDTDGLRYRCHVIDFGMVRSLDQVQKDKRNRNLRHANKNPFWYTQLSNKSKIADYIREQGMEEYYQRGWEFSVTQWGQTLFLKQFLKILFGDTLYLGFNNDKNFKINTQTNNTTKKYDQYAVTVAGWCRASTMIKKLVQTLEQYQQQRPNLEDALFRLVLEQSTILERGVSLLNCTNYEAVLT